MEKKTQNSEVSETTEKLLEEYNSQVSPDGKHTYLVSVYSDYSDTTCC